MLELQIIQQIKSFIEFQKPFKFPDSESFVLGKLEELELILGGDQITKELPLEETPELLLTEDFTIEDLKETTVVEEPVVEKTPTKRPRKTK